jgi:hypothetical protein
VSVPRLTLIFLPHLSSRWGERDWADRHGAAPMDTGRLRRAARRNKAIGNPRRITRWGATEQHFIE